MRRLHERLCVLTALLAGLSVPASARWNAQYGWSTPDVRGWFYSQRMTPESQKRLGVQFDSCCTAGDVFHTRFRVVSDNSRYGRDEWQYEKDGRWLPIPADIIERTETPTGEPVLFLFAYDGNPHVKQGTPVCFKLPPTKG
jgi:hypothetical protein